MRVKLQLIMCSDDEPERNRHRYRHLADLQACATCPDCSTPLKAKGYHTPTFRALFGTFYATLDAVPPVPDEERYPVWLIPRHYHTIMADASSRIPCRTGGRCWSGAQTPTTTS